MNEADIGKIISKKAYRDGTTLFFSDALDSMFIIIAKQNDSIKYRKVIPYSSTTKDSQRKAAKRSLADIKAFLMKSSNLEDYEL